MILSIISCSKHLTEYSRKEMHLIEILMTHFIWIRFNFTKVYGN